MPTTLILFTFLLLVVHSPGSLSSLFCFLINHVVVPLYSITALCYILYSWLKYCTHSTKSQSFSSSTMNDNLDSSNESHTYYDTPPTDMKLNLSGTFKLIKHEGFEEFLAANGVPYLLRKAALSTQPIHTITHHGDTVRVQINGIINGDITYLINGPSVESTIHTRRFEDTVTYLEEGDGIRITKRAMEGSGGAREIVVTRRIIDNRKNMLLTSTSFFNDDRPPIQYTQLLERQ